MGSGFFVLPLLAILIISSISFVFAENIHTIIMPSGASDPDAPYFWSEKTTGITTGEITVYPDDTVLWENADTAFHTITSVTQSGEVDGKFDSGFINAGDSYSRQFFEIGNFYYFCSIHPWMNGVVHVVKNPGSVKSIHNIGSGLSDDGLGFTVKYVLDANLQNAVVINSHDKTLTFKISGETENEQITLILPPKLIDNPTSVWVDGLMTDFETEITSTGTKLIIPISQHSKEIKIMGTHVIPEFGFLAMGILTVGLITTLFFTRSKITLN
ncbi:MAG: PEFG-CTERM sorting domain-containing protein [Nitrosopumilus sp.]|uniref:PEFG-CTERM sorting domain-containing protein n=1 Tax=Nitrosopumilus sp. TaxID=2024843 RepID=UPI00247E5269|nr:PEFG-CTERM sorting domain-containing protein [Nitrosopumilus sp.]MCV0392324.1 PEFG-CTERM sorting domain-containing protein [Nitrosopumilus sp.]